LFHGSDLRPVIADDPARRGEPLTLFAVGMGELEPSMSAGVLPPTPAPELPYRPCIVFSEPPPSGRPPRPLNAAPSLWAGAAAGRIGVYRVDFEAPASLGPGWYMLSVTGPPTLDASGRKGCTLGYQGPTLDSFMIEVK
jgi:uncharacterized protein (TIGR03437 family)